MALFFLFEWLLMIPIKSQKINVQEAFVSILASVYFIASSFFVLKSIIRLRQTGTSPAVRKLLVQRVFLQWIYVFVGTLDAWYAYFIRTNYKLANVIVIVEVISIIGTIIRITEPFVWATFVSLFGCKKPLLITFSELSLNSFIQSTMNVEFVCLML